MKSLLRYMIMMKGLVLNAHGMETENLDLTRLKAHLRLNEFYLDRTKYYGA